MKKNKKSTETKPLIYIPPGARINIENQKDTFPNTRYEKRRVIFDINSIRKIVGGRYGKKDD